MPLRVAASIPLLSTQSGPAWRHEVVIADEQSGRPAATNSKRYHSVARNSPNRRSFHNAANVWECSDSNCVERVAQIAAQVVDVLDAHRKPHQRVADPEIGTQRGRNRTVRHQRGMLDEAFDAAEALGQRKQVAALEEALGSGKVGRKDDRDHAARRRCAAC